MVNMQAKTFYAVEYKSGNDGQTFDIFTTLKSAKSFTKEMISIGGEYKPLFIFKADFNLENVYIENNTWNYEDFSNTIIKYHSYKKILN